MVPWFAFVLAIGGPAQDPDEAEARRLYAAEAQFEKRWPVEFHIRVLEPLTQRIAAGLRDRARALGPAHFHQSTRWGWGALGPAEPLPMGASRHTWKKDQVQDKTPAQLRTTLQEYLASFAHVDFARLKIKRGKVIGPGRFWALAKLEVAGPLAATDKTALGGLRHDHGKVELSFRKTPQGWRLDRLELRSMVTDTAPAPFFEDTSKRWLGAVSKRTHRLLRVSSASDHIYTLLKAGKTPPGARAQPVAMDAHPGVVVVDIDGDRFDDLFVWDVLGDAVLLRNQAGRGFEEVTDHYGARFQNVSAAAFADLNNDGVQDLVLGRWFQASALYFGEMKAGRWRPIQQPLKLPSQVATVSLVDVDRDGLLDIFLGTAAHDHHSRAVAKGQAGEAPDANVDQRGPPNALLINRGDHFEDRTATWGLTQARNTLAAAFEDFNGDGLADVFLGNDFARGNLLENRGQTFVDVSAKHGADRVLFGMGASWGDLNNDGAPDLYVSAMASSAGQRIMADRRAFSKTLSAKDRDLRHLAARGSTLLLSQAGALSDATASPQFAQARQAGWSYGAQFIDADNDGHLDIYAPNGFFTSPGATEGTFRDL